MPFFVGGVGVLILRIGSWFEAWWFWEPGTCFALDLFRRQGAFYGGLIGCRGRLCGVDFVVLGSVLS